MIDFPIFSFIIMMVFALTMTLTTYINKRLKFGFERYKVAYQIYLLPTIKVTADRMLYGYWTIDLVWLQWGFSITIDKP